MLPGLLTSGGSLAGRLDQAAPVRGADTVGAALTSTMVTIRKSTPRTTINASRECPRCRPGRNCPGPRVSHGKGQRPVADVSHLCILACRTR